MKIELKERSRDDLLEIISAKDMKITMQKIEIEETKEEIEMLHSIIKEVRNELNDFNESYLIDEGDYGVYNLLKEIIEKLDKENI